MRQECLSDRYGAVQMSIIIIAIIISTHFHLWKKGIDDSTPNLSRKSSYQRKLSAEIKAMYTTHAMVTITILHFNDVYNVEPKDREPVGGAARFATIIKSFLPENPLVFFSGDALNPSISKNCFV